NAEGTLLFLLLDLLFRYLELRGYDADLRDRSCDSQHDPRNRIAFSGTQIAVESLRGETFRRNCEAEGAWSNVGKGELPVVARQRLLIQGLICTSESHRSSRSGDSGWIHKTAADPSRYLRIRWLLARGW